MNTHQIQYLYKPPTSPQQLTSRMTINDQISPIRDIIMPKTNRVSQNITRNSARGIPQLITTKTQPSVARESCQITRESIHIKQPSSMPIDNFTKAIYQLSQIKQKYDKSLESQIDAIIIMLKTSNFDKENCNPNQELKQQIIQLQSSNEKLQNELLHKKCEKTNIQNLEQIIVNLESQNKSITNQRDILKTENEKLQLKLLNKEQHFVSLQQEIQQQRNSFQPYELLYNQQRQKIIELEELIQSFKQINCTENVIKQQDYQDLKWKFEQSIIAYQRKDKDLQSKVEEIKKQKYQVEQLLKRNQTLEIKLLEIMETEVKQRIIV
ncbi:unnamed protein product [Paramecium pentaurelia]|uniref:Uncharacterized protein n=1 Tax=Paramecium pentaurelia TaxID=43138 RepID=A0A8S1SVK1_9CILI|nr:unnamed protein product [Paramecium pentaurelia]